MAFAAPDGRQDNTHHNNCGVYEIADDFDGFDRTRPDPLDTFAIPASPIVPGKWPLGN